MQVTEMTLFKMLQADLEALAQAVSCEKIFKRDCGHLIEAHKVLAEVIYGKNTHLPKGATHEESGISGRY